MVAGRHHRTNLCTGLILGCTLLLHGGASCAQALTVDEALRAELLATIGRSDSFDDRYDAEVWLTDFSARMAPYVKDDSERLDLLRLIHLEATRAEVAPELVMAVIEIESMFDRFAISRVGARGLMQVMPFWVREIGRPEDNLFDVQTNLRYGCTILKHYLKREKGDLWRALGRYNGRINNNPYQNKVLKALNRRWFRR